MSQKNIFLKLSNPLIAAILRSPLHGMLSRSTMLVTVKGRKSGKTYTTPVNYIRQGNMLYTLSSRERTWWRNLRGEAEVTLCFQGEQMKGWGKVVEDDLGVAEALSAYLQLAPQYARYLNIQTDKDGHPIAQDIAQKAQSRVVVTIDLGAGGDQL
ncbi:MAG: nitroreductase family deazaflavin-dependent oxidoreductase [Anaerolineales bacterium]|nr:nitroreductase family deazaflavin-dependent oxidoreductase [Anaerolineales bacterium]